MPSDQPSEKQKAFDFGRRGGEGFNYYYWNHDPEVFEAYQRGAKLCEKFGPPSLAPKFIEGW